MKRKKSKSNEAMDSILAKRPEKSNQITKVTSGSDIFDLALGGGFPIGKIINIVGDNSTGKTLLSCELIARAKQEYGDKLKWYYDDAETGFSFDTKEMYGFEIMKEECTPSYTVEDFDLNLTNKRGRY